MTANFHKLESLSIKFTGDATFGKGSKMTDNFHKLESSSIEHIDYHDDKDTLEIKFTSGAIYHYPECDKKHYEALKIADSAGTYFHKNLRGAAYKRIN